MITIEPKIAALINNLKLAALRRRGLQDRDLPDAPTEAELHYELGQALEANAGDRNALIDLHSIRAALRSSSIVDALRAPVPVDPAVAEAQHRARLVERCRAQATAHAKEAGIPFPRACDALGAESWHGKSMECASGEVAAIYRELAAGAL
jgi:hypothetical protein